ncbi:MAG: FlgO family outer membrane protein [Candidatus Eisenbacteria bacterium]
MTPSMPQTIGRYRVLEKLGEGGMGVVYAALDDRLDRRIAIKTIRSSRDESLHERFWREARAAASVSHPNVCPIYEVGEAEDGTLFLAMELLEGESLGDRLKRGAPATEESLRIIGEVLAALEALHARHLVHRDLKPSNVFLTRHGVKLVDFGLARPSVTDPVTAIGITQPGMVMGTPRYMAPEQVSGRNLDGRADLFAAGVLLYEMLSGRPAFEGETMMQVLHAVMYETPLPLTGTPLAAAIDSVVHKALAKRPEDRFESAAAMAAALRAISGDRTPSGFGNLEVEPTITAPLRPATRLVVLPFRMLRPDAEIDFLAFSLPDAVSSALAGLNSLTVRPSGTIASLGTETPDIARIAHEANVDVVLMGTLLRAGEQVRVTTQLVQAPSGTLLASHTSQAPLGELFQLQDELSQRIVDALALPLTSRERRLVHRDIPADPAAYELYLRANQVMNEPSRWDEALQLYRDCLAKDDSYAPAWARLGRVARLMAKFGEHNQSEMLRTAEGAFRRALEINPDLSSAHHLHAYLDVELGRARFAMVRLLDRARSRRNDTELYSGLVIACRYCGLLDASAAAHDQVRRLDPGAKTSVAHTYFFMQDWDRCLSTDDGPMHFSRVTALLTMGRIEEAQELVGSALDRIGSKTMQIAMRGYVAAGTGDSGTFLQFHEAMQKTAFNDPEALLFMARGAARLGLLDLALRSLDRAIKGGHTCPSFIRADTWLEPLRDRPEFERLVADAEKVRREARAHYLAASGEQLLGVGTAGPE